MKDTLGAWLAQRYGTNDNYNVENEEEFTYWEHEAAAVRRAVERGGFKVQNAYMPWEGEFGADA